MGIEWELGCTRCKTFLWLGSMKPWKWKGFQIGADRTRRFIGFHLHGENRPCHLLLTADYSGEAPWEDEVTELTWKEDILSRNFCFDSLKPWKEGVEAELACAECGLDYQEGDESFLRKGQYLVFCSDACWKKYQVDEREGIDKRIHDSSLIPMKFKENRPFVAECTKCKEDIKIEGEDFLPLAEFFTDHVGLEHELRFRT